VTDGNDCTSLGMQLSLALLTGVQPQKLALPVKVYETPVTGDCDENTAIA
jgi:hypothetical protein